MGDGRRITIPSHLRRLNEIYQTTQRASARTWTASLKQMTAEADAAQKKYDDSLAELERLKTQYKQQRGNVVYAVEPVSVVLGKKILTLPILDAFNSPRKIENLWSDGLDAELRQLQHGPPLRSLHDLPSVAGQDRCPVSRPTPAYVGEESLEMVVIPPAKDAAAQAAAGRERKAACR